MNLINKILLSTIYILVINDTRIKKHHTAPCKKYCPQINRMNSVCSIIFIDAVGYNIKIGL